MIQRRLLIALKLQFPQQTGLVNNFLLPVYVEAIRVEEVLLLSFDQFFDGWLLATGDRVRVNQLGVEEQIRLRPVCAVLFLRPGLDILDLLLNLFFLHLLLLDILLDQFELPVRFLGREVRVDLKLRDYSLLKQDLALVSCHCRKLNRIAPHIGHGLLL